MYDIVQMPHRLSNYWRNDETSDRSHEFELIPPRRLMMINQAEEFLKRAAECERMVKSVPDPQSKDAWRRMAERWHRCAQVATNASLAAAALAAAQHGSHRHRRAE